MEKNTLNPEKLTGAQKAAILFLTMGEEFSTTFFKGLDDKSIKKIGKHMAGISYIPAEVLNAVMDEFLGNYEKDANLVVSGKEFLEQVVNKTLDTETARDVFKVIGNKNINVPFSDLEYIPAEQVMNVIKGEHPQTIAVILSYLPEEKAAEILSLFPEGVNSDIALRIVKLGQVQDEFVNELDESIRRELSRTEVVTRKFHGVETLANILNEVDGSTEEAVLSHIENEDSELAEQIRQKMFIFEDLLLMEDKSFREILQNVDNQSLAKALKTSTEEMKQKIFNNLSERASEMLKEDIEVMGPIRLKEVEEAQQTIIKIAKKLEEEGRIVLAGKGKEDVLV